MNASEPDIRDALQAWLANVDLELAKTRIVRAELIARGGSTAELSPIISLLEETRSGIMDSLGRE